MTATNLSDFGVDIAGFQYLSPVCGLASGRLNLCYAIARRLTTPAGALDDHPEYGFDIRALLNDDFTAPKLSAARASIQAQCEQDERVQAATVSISLPETGVMTITIQLEDAIGPFDLVMSVNQVSAAILSINGQAVAAATDVGGSTTVASSVVIVQGQPGPAGAPGSGGGGGGGGGSMLTLAKDEPQADSSGTEVVVFQDVFDLGILGGTITAAFSGWFKTASGTATYRMRIGGTYGAADGTIVASLTTASTTPVKLGSSSSLSNPTGLQPVKVTIQSPSAGVQAEAEGIVASAR